MNKFTRLIVSVAAIALPISMSNAMDTNFINTALVKACVDVKNNKPFTMKKNLKKNHLTVKLISEKLMCNGESAYDFAMTHNADRTAKAVFTGKVFIKDVAKLNQDKIWVWLD